MKCMLWGEVTHMNATLWQGAVHCPYYMKTGSCKYGSTCKFDHPTPGEVMAKAGSQGTSTEGDEKEAETD